MKRVLTAVFVLVAVAVANLAAAQPVYPIPPGARYPTWEELFRGQFFQSLGRDAERILLGGIPYDARPYHSTAYPHGYSHPRNCPRGYVCIQQAGPVTSSTTRIEHRRIEVASERVAAAPVTPAERLPTLDEAVAKATTALGGKPTDGRAYQGVRTLSRADEVPKCANGNDAQKVKQVNVQGYELERWFCP